MTTVIHPRWTPGGSSPSAWAGQAGQATTLGTGGVLMQNGSVIAYLSKKFSCAELKYCFHHCWLPWCYLEQGYKQQASQSTWNPVHNLTLLCGPSGVHTIQDVAYSPIIRLY
jgi:hypothetical protein